MTFSFQYFTAMTAKKANITRPRNGCRIRDQVPPPSRLVRNQNAGWKNARPEAASRMKVIATVQ
jgi:hypothetical protein